MRSQINPSHQIFLYDILAVKESMKVDCRCSWEIHVPHWARGGFGLFPERNSQVISSPIGVIKEATGAYDGLFRRLATWIQVLKVKPTLCILLYPAWMAYPLGLPHRFFSSWFTIAYPPWKFAGYFNLDSSSVSMIRLVIFCWITVLPQSSSSSSSEIESNQGWWTDSWEVVVSSREFEEPTISKSTLEKGMVRYRLCWITCQ